MAILASSTIDTSFKDEENGQKHEDTMEQQPIPLNGKEDQGENNIDLAIWPGWVELESEPAYFNVILKDMGITGIKVNDVFSLEREHLMILPQPVHALVFLFKYRETVREDPDCAFPDDVWFARQTPRNACATYALLNIVNNITGLHLGQRLEDFRTSTWGMTPLEKGDHLDRLHWVRAIHNSFATENDLIEEDMMLQKSIHDAKKQEAALKAKRARAARAAAKQATAQDPIPIIAPTRASDRIKGRETTVASEESPPAKRVRTDDGTPRKSRRSRQSIINSGEAAYHFCAYMPIKGKVWKLDGLEPTPEMIGECPIGTSWLDVAVPEVQARMMQYEAGAIEFNVMAVSQDPILSHREDLLKNLKAVVAVEDKLAMLAEDWYELDDIKPADLLSGPCDDYAISHTDLVAVHLSQADADVLGSKDDLVSLLDLRKDIAKVQPACRAAVRDEMESAKQDYEAATHRRFDYARFIRTWMEDLVEVEVLGDLIESVSG